MIKTIIADDEKWICKLISNMVDWEQLGFSVISKAYDGETLLDQIEKLQPDLVITDIRMPGLNGIDVIRKCSERKFTTKFVIISGYGDFGYAKTAIDYGVLGYLLKPVEKNDLSDLLTTIKNGTFCSQADDERSDMLRIQLEQSKLRCLEYYFQNKLSTPNSFMPSIHELNSEFGSHFSEGNFRIFYVKLDPHKREPFEIDEEISCNTAELCYSTLQQACFELCTIREPFSVTIIANYSTDKERLIQGLVSDLLYACTCKIPNIAKYDMTIGIGSLVNDPVGLYESLSSAQNAARARIQYGANKLIDLSGHKFVIPVHIISDDTEKHIRDYVRDRDSISSRKLANEALLCCMSNDNIAPYLPYYIANSALERILSLAPPKVNAAWTDSNSDENIHLQIENCRTIEDMVVLLSSVFTSIGDMISSSSHGGHNAIELVKTYIDDNYNKEIKLEDAAKHVYLSATYVSELFKKETGINFSKYLVSKRMEMAKTFLLDARCKINDVALMVGYNDTKHFSRLFKNYVGITPAQYKKMFS